MIFGYSPHFWRFYKYALTPLTQISRFNDHFKNLLNLALIFKHNYYDLAFERLIATSLNNNKYKFRPAPEGSMRQQLSVGG